MRRVIAQCSKKKRGRGALASVAAPCVGNRRRQRPVAALQGFGRTAGDPGDHSRRAAPLRLRRSDPVALRAAHARGRRVQPSWGFTALGVSGEGVAPCWLGRSRHAVRRLPGVPAPLRARVVVRHRALLLWARVPFRASSQRPPPARCRPEPAAKPDERPRRPTALLGFLLPAALAEPGIRISRGPPRHPPRSGLGVSTPSPVCAPRNLADLSAGNALGIRPSGFRSSRRAVPLSRPSPLVPFFPGPGARCRTSLGARLQRVAPPGNPCRARTEARPRPIPSWSSPPLGPSLPPPQDPASRALPLLRFRGRPREGSRARRFRVSACGGPGVSRDSTAHERRRSRALALPGFLASSRPSTFRSAAACRRPVERRLLRPTPAL